VTGDEVESDGGESDEATERALDDRGGGSAKIAEIARMAEGENFQRCCL